MEQVTEECIELPSGVDSVLDDWDVVSWVTAVSLRAELFAGLGDVRAGPEEAGG